MFLRLSEGKLIYLESLLPDLLSGLLLFIVCFFLKKVVIYSWFLFAARRSAHSLILLDGFHGRRGS